MKIYYILLTVQQPAERDRFSEPGKLLTVLPFQARLKVLKHRDDHVASVMDDAKASLITITRDKAKYTGILQQLLTQGGAQNFQAQSVVRFYVGALFCFPAPWNNCFKDYR